MNDYAEVLTPVRKGYRRLYDTLIGALHQAQAGKGALRHGHGAPFEEQPAMEITKRLGLGFPLGQAMKKIIESQQPGLTEVQRIAELDGAMVYISTAIMRIQDELAQSADF